MTINGMDELINAMGNDSSRIIIDKASIANASAGNYFSLWRALGQPGQGAIPTTAAVASNSLIGSLQFTQQTAPATSYLGQFEAVVATAGMTVEIHDRLMHMGGLSGTSTAAQTVGVDIDTNLATSNLDARKGDANYSDIQWWLEWYTDTGATASNATVNVTYNDASSGNLTVVAVGGTVRASRMIPLNSLIPSASSGKYIRDVNTVQLSASTGTVGNFGVTATRYRGAVFCPVANGRFVATWAELGMTEIYNSSALFPVVIANTTTTGAVRATGKIIHG
jgi:hypothetical protein